MNNVENLLVYKGKNKTTYYYRTTVDGKRKKINLGHNLPNALQKVREIESTGTIAPTTLLQIWELYSKDVSDGLLARPINTQKDYERCWNKICDLLGDMNMKTIVASQIKQYMRHRTAKVRANREKAMISILFNYARNYYDFDGPNPCRDLKGNKETGRKKYVEKWEFEEIYVNADEILKDVLDLLVYTGQRVSDVLDLQMTDIKNNFILTGMLMHNHVSATELTGKKVADLMKVRNNKTGKKINIIIAGEFEVIVDRIMDRRKRDNITSDYIITNNKGEQLSMNTLQDKFKRARKLAGYKPYEIQMRDLRSKNACDSDLETANIRLAHTNMSMTEHYRNKVMTKIVMPLEKII